ncbi:DUF4307 domain-containing protein [Amycolatopsis nigrescens]|uniref:DUF4307 domain-containing protein n=1 Tax=Amycolatopsis nigrescens TaxID=381445 RepID=UPI000365212A|nr:DUF4307 domain-containing protein [Amycolatopsis nigrescens]
MRTGQAGTAGAGTRPPLPEGRYGSAGHGQAARENRPRGKARRWVFGVIAVVVSSAAALLLYQNLGSVPIEAQRLGFEEQPGNSMSITIDVTRDEPDRPGVCVVRVRDISGAESGRREIFVPPGAGSTVLTAVVRSGTRPVTADIFGCSYDVPQYLSTP